jgi:hypothetical protein
MWRADGRRCCSVSETAIDVVIVPSRHFEPGPIGPGRRNGLGFAAHGRGGERAGFHSVRRDRVRRAAQATTAVSRRAREWGIEAAASAALSKMRRYWLPTSHQTMPRLRS